MHAFLHRNDGTERLMGMREMNAHAGKCRPPKEGREKKRDGNGRRGQNEKKMGHKREYF
jgi:prophage tail gpP-like protein